LVVVAVLQDLERAGAICAETENRDVPVAQRFHFEVASEVEAPLE
jgi:hypothetical protein